MSTIRDELRAAAQNVYNKLASETGTVTIFDQERLGDALRSQSAGVRVPADEVFEMVRAAYVRGTEWMTENPGQYSYIAKAAYDYADKTTSSLALEPQQEEAVADEDRMQKISEVITHLQSIKERFGDTCVYIRRGGMSWGAVALNYRDDDKKHGVFDLQAKHDRDMIARAEQVERLIAERNDLRAQLTAHPTPVQKVQESQTVSEGQE